MTDRVRRPADPGGSDLGPLPALPEGTTSVTIGKYAADSHQRGGRRQRVGRVAPADLLTRLSAEGPGRYRVSCVDRSGYFLYGGVLSMATKN